MSGDIPTGVRYAGDGKERDPLKTGRSRVLDKGSTIVSHEQVDQWIAAMEPIEPLHFVGCAAPAALFFQAARHDEAIPEDDAMRFHQAGREPKLVKWYDTDHELNDEAYHDQVAWLATYIAIDVRRFRW